MYFFRLYKLFALKIYEYFPSSILEEVVMLNRATRFCRDCYNFEDRRDIDGTVVCARNHSPGVCCEDFVVKDESLKETRLNIRFCSECINFEDRNEIDGTVICARRHSPGVSCEDFVDKLERLTKIRRDNNIKTTIVEHYINNSHTINISHYLISSQPVKNVLTESIRKHGQPAR